MANLIIGNTTPNSTAIWIRGERQFPIAQVSLHSDAPGIQTPIAEEKTLSAEKDYTDVVFFTNLKCDTPYQVLVNFASTKEQFKQEKASLQVKGEFRTFPDPQQDPHSFSFLLGSCNLSIFTLNSFLALLLGLVGTLAMRKSLERPVSTWDMDFPKKWWATICRLFPRFFGCLSDKAIYYGIGFISKATKGKQPGKPMLKSPFLKLCTLFDCWWLFRFLSGENEPAMGDTLIGTTSGATGILAFSPVVETGSWKDKNAVGTLVLTRLVGNFQNEECLKMGNKTIAMVSGEGAKFFLYPVPKFIIHAGDQIYFDFPFRNRRPDLEQYRRTYREAWGEDESLQCFLAHYPHFMTLDDHEIFDQFAKGRKSPLEEISSEYYLQHAEQAYREYVHARQPESFNSNSLYYTFQHGAVQFFVLNTRTERDTTKKQMISKEQMKCFLDWLEKHQNDLKFVVSSVPFVAEISSAKKDQKPEADNGARHTIQSQNTNLRGEIEKNEDDKWSSPSFRDQREKIIEHIHSKRIKRVVFLVGDMHCSFYATMQVGRGRNYECLTLHELAGGPFHQLQLADQNQFVNLTEHSFKTVEKGDLIEIPYRTTIKRFYSGANAAMHVTVDYQQKTKVDLSRSKKEPEIEWKVIRTLTESEPITQGAMPTDTPAMSGRIRFVERDRVR